MAFNTAGFLFLFFPAAFLLYRLMPGRRTKTVFLAIASALFYGFGGLASLPVLFAAFLWDYLFGRLIAKDEKRSKLWCGIAAAGNLAPVSYTHLDVYKRQAVDVWRELSGRGEHPGHDAGPPLAGDGVCTAGKILPLRLHSGGNDPFGTQQPHRYVRNAGKGGP